MIPKYYLTHSLEKPELTGIFPSPESFPQQWELFQYLEIFFPERLKLFQEILFRIQFEKFAAMGDQLIVDLTMPAEVGGYYTWGGSEKVIAINPLLLIFGTETQIAHVLVHEGLHAGVYTDGVEIPEEVITETYAKAAMLEFYGYSDLHTGYDDMVEEMAPYMSGLTFSELVNLVEEGTEETFDNFLEFVILGPLLSDMQADNFTFEEINHRLRTQWPMLQRLFPRMLSLLEGRMPTADAQSTMQASDFKLEGLLRKAAAHLIRKGLLDSLIAQVLSRAKPQSLAEALAVLHLSGYAYISDFYPEELQAAVDTFFAQREL